MAKQRQVGAYFDPLGVGMPMPSTTVAQAYFLSFEWNSVNISYAIKDDRNHGYRKNGEIVFEDIDDERLFSARIACYNSGNNCYSLKISEFCEVALNFQSRVKIIDDDRRKNIDDLAKQKFPAEFNTVYFKRMSTSQIFREVTSGLKDDFRYQLFCTCALRVLTRGGYSPQFEKNGNGNLQFASPKPSVQLSVAIITGGCVLMVLTSHIYKMVSEEKRER